MYRANRFGLTDWFETTPCLYREEEERSEEEDIRVVVSRLLKKIFHIHIVLCFVTLTVILSLYRRESVLLHGQKQRAAKHGGTRQRNRRQ